MVRQVQGIAPVREQLHRLANAARLVNAALLADGQVHGQVQKRIVLAGLGIVHAAQGSVHIGQLRVVFGVLVNPQARYCFNSFQRLTCLGLGINSTKKLADIGLGR